MTAFADQDERVAPPLTAADAPSGAVDPGPRDRGSDLPPSPPTRRGGLSIQSKLLLMLLLVSLVSSVVVGTIGFVNGRNSLREAAFEQLTTIRELRADAIEREIAGLQLGVKIDSSNASAVDGSAAFIKAFAELRTAKISAAQSASIQKFYAEDFVPKLEQRTGQTFSPEAFAPASAAGKYLQAHYVVDRPYDDFDTGLALTDAGDGSAWTKANITYGPYFADLVREVGYEDLLVLDRSGNVAYEAYKSVDLGANILDEPYRDTALTGAFRKAMQSGTLDQVFTTDFEPFLPSLNEPNAWVVSPVGTPTNIVGALAIQVPSYKINEVMTGRDQWQAEGLGETGEVYLAGPDKLMRSTSRLLVQHEGDYAATVIANGTSPNTAERVVQLKDPVLLQPVAYTAVNEASGGNTGVAIAADYTNRESLVAYAPLEIEGLNWVIVAKIDAAEAFAPVNAFTRNVLVSLIAIILVVSLLSLLLAQVFTRPISRLVAAVRRLAGGDLAVQVPRGSRDEIGDLGLAFNDMATSLRLKQDLIDRQQAENQKLLHTLMPASVARRYQRGDEAIAERHENVTVLFAELTGFDEYARGLSSEVEIAQLNALMREFDDAAAKAGVEKVRTLRGGYLASSGLSVPRVDNVRRSIDFARGMSRALDRFNLQHGTSLALRAGVDTGSVTSGLVARTSLAYDLWGDAVSLAYRVRSVSGQPGVFVSQAVKDQLPDSVELQEAGSVDLGGQSQTVWRLVL